MYELKYLISGSLVSAVLLISGCSSVSDSLLRDEIDQYYENYIGKWLEDSNNNFSVSAYMPASMVSEEILDYVDKYQKDKDLLIRTDHYFSYNGMPVMYSDSNLDRTDDLGYYWEKDEICYYVGAMPDIITSYYSKVISQDIIYHELDIELYNDVIDNVLREMRNDCGVTGVSHVNIGGKDYMRVKTNKKVSGYDADSGILLGRDDEKFAGAWFGETEANSAMYYVINDIELSDTIRDRVEKVIDENK